MSGKKVLFINEEINPYVPLTHMSKLGKEMPKIMAEAGYEIRAFLPKWGNINERRNQLHEVIRLSGMNIIINDTDHPLVIKVATLPAVHIQVYFIENEDFFKKRLQANDKNGKEYTDNYERSIFFARSVIETTKLLKWAPEVIQCQGWVSLMAPFYLKTAYKDEPCFAKSKIVYALHNNNLQNEPPKNLIDLMAFRNIDQSVIQDYGMPFHTFMDVQKFAISFCSGVVCAEPDVAPELIEFAKSKGIPVLDYALDEELTKRAAEFYNSLM